MRRILLVLAVIALLTASALPAMADQGDNNDWWGHNNNNNNSWGNNSDWWGHNNNNNSWGNNNTFCNWYPSWWGWHRWCYSPWWGWWQVW
jgi:hypothetical protein